MTTRLPRMSDCRACTLPIRFVKLDTGSTMPVNPAPVEHGTVCAQVRDGQLWGYVQSRSKPPHGTHPLRFTPHAATCSPD